MNRRARNQAAELDARLRAIIDNAPEGAVLYVLEERGRIVAVKVCRNGEEIG